MKTPRERRLDLAGFLFMTWLVAATSMITGVAPPVALSVALVLTLLLLRLAHHPGRQGIPSGAEAPPWTWTGAYLLKRRNMNRQTQPERSVRFAAKLVMPIHLIRQAKQHHCEVAEEGEEQLDRLCEVRRAGVLTLLALFASLLTGTALARETFLVNEKIEYIYLLTIMDLVSVTLLPLFIGVFFRCEIDSTLTMISLSAAVQAILFRLAPSMPPWLFLTLAEITLPGIPLGLVLFFGRMDRRLEAEGIETTTGKLLSGKRRRMRLRERAAGR